MLLSDFIIDFLAKNGMCDVFTVSGGGIMYLLDSLGRHPDMRYWCNYHEQACAAAAEAYARIRGTPGVCLVTTGPGGANALSALPAAYVDSIPLLVICGQVRTTLIADYASIRQIGPQEGNIVGMAKPVTKYAVSVHDPNRIRYEMERAFYEATSRRPGPALVEVPLDIQAAKISPEALEGYVPPPRECSPSDLAPRAREVLDRLRDSKRPILVLGNGIHRAKAEELTRTLLDVLRLPVVLPLTGKDLLEEDHPCNQGIFGTAGQRRANFAIQTSDCLIAIGAGLNVQKVGFNVAGFAPRATKIIIDIDHAQLDHQLIRPDVAVCADAAVFISAMLDLLKDHPYCAPEDWRLACKRWWDRYPIIVNDYFSEPEFVNSYVFMDHLADLLTPEDILVTGNALDTTSYFQAYRVKKGQRTLNSGWGAMGWCLPMTVGAAISAPGRRVVCATGDGSFQFNIQELLTMARYNLNVVLFILNNQGYSNIRATQDAFFNSRYVGADYASGVANPDFQSIAAAYGFDYAYIQKNAELPTRLKSVLSNRNRILCELHISPRQGIAPKASSFRRPDGTFESRPLEDMAPFLSRDEIADNMGQFDK